jgi:hypothetical protein
MLVAVAQPIETRFVPFNFAEEPKAIVSYTKTLVGWYNVSLPRCKRPLLTLSPDTASLIGIDGRFSLGCLSVNVDELYDLFVRRWVEKDTRVFVHVSKFDLIA